MKHAILACAAFLGVAGAAALAHQDHPPIPAPTASFTDPGATSAIPFDLFRSQRIIVQGSLNGAPANMLVDSGAGMTVVDRIFAERIGLKGGQSINVRGAAGQVPGRIVSDVSLNVGSLRLTKMSVLILDLSDVARSIGRPIPVVLGHEAFAASAVTIDFPKREMHFAAPATFTPPAAATRLDLGENGRLRTVKMSIGGLASIDADLDLGNGGTLTIAQSYWMAQPTLAALPSARGQSGGVGGVRPSRRVTLPTVEFGGRQFSAVPATLNDDPDSLPTKGANVGIEMLKPFVVTIDFSNKAMYLVPAAAHTAFPKDRAGTRTELAGDRLKVVFVSPDGPAAAAGLKAGDEILSIDGKRIDGDYYRSAKAEWNQAAAGTLVELQRADGSRVPVKLRDYF